MNVLVVGKGNVGTTLAREASACGHKSRLVSSRGRLDIGPTTELLFLAVRETQVDELVERIATANDRSKRSAGTHRTVVATVSGSLDMERLVPLKAADLLIGRLHPIVSFVSKKRSAEIRGAFALLEGDRRARSVLKTFAESIGLRPMVRENLAANPAYHAALAIVANGSAALASLGAELLRDAGTPARLTEQILGELLRTVACNISREGLPKALSGPVRRGDGAAALRQAATIRRPENRPLILELLRIQVEMARRIGEARAADLDALERKLKHLGLKGR